MGSRQGSYFHRPISEEPTKSLGIKTEYTPKLVNIFNCLAYDWIVKDERKSNVSQDKRFQKESTNF
jgi:hypothetical protein